MSAVQWNPRQYLRYQDERSRPFFELLQRVDCPHAEEVVDLGCGPANATLALLERWPGARVLGVDNSPEMLAQAQSLASKGRLEFELADISNWSASRPLDVIVSNAAFQWVTGHLARFADFVQMLRPGGWFAFQVPNMAQAPSHKMLNELGASARWKDQLGAFVDSMAVNSASEYLECLQDCGCTVDAWETTYLQVLAGENAIVEWARGSSMRPFLTALSSEEAAQFEADYAARIASAYPQNAHGTLYAFQRLFVAAQKQQ